MWGWELQGFQCRGIDGWGVQRSNAPDRGIEIVEGVLHDNGGDLRGDAAKGLVFIHQDSAMCLPHGIEDGVLIEFTLSGTAGGVSRTATVTLTVQ